MDMEFNSDQRALVDALQDLVERHVAPPKEGNVSAAVHSHYSEALDRDLTDAGYFGIAREEGFGPFEAALLVEEVARSPSVVEVGASALVAPQLLKEDVPHPVALMRGHGSIAAAQSVRHVVFRAVYTEVNARMESEALRLGEPTFLNDEEAAAAMKTNDALVDRPWDLWKRRVTAK